MQPADFPHVYLLTSPRFLNYKFSPASFWYLYSPDLQLRYIIAEVNNTFDERRIYLFPQPDVEGTPAQECAKDFHVSPFNSRHGSYSVMSEDPDRAARISVTVSLKSSKGHLKLVAKWWSVAEAVDVTGCGVLSGLGLLFGWGWTILITCKSMSLPRCRFYNLNRLTGDRHNQTLE